MPGGRKDPQELMDCGVGLVFGSGRPIAQVAADLGVPSEALRKRARRAEVDSGQRTDLLTTQEREEIKKPRKENYELRRANEILKSASVVSAKELNTDRTGEPPHRRASRPLRCPADLPGPWRVGVRLLPAQKR